MRKKFVFALLAIAALLTFSVGAQAQQPTPTSIERRASRVRIDAQGQIRIEPRSDKGITFTRPFEWGGSTYSGTSSYQPFSVDLNLGAAAGSTGGKFLSPIMGNIFGANLTKAGNYVAGGTFVYNITGTNASTYPKAGLLGIVADGTTTANCAVCAVLDGDSEVTTARSAFGVFRLNSTPGSGFDYGLDLFRGAHDGYPALGYLVGDIRFSDGTVQSTAGTGGTVTNVSGTSPISVATGTTTPVVSLNDTAVTPGAYTAANITVDQKGRITAASNGDLKANAALDNLTGDLPFANLTPASAASKLLGRGDSGAGDFEEITLGSGLTMTGTTLSAAGGGSGDMVGPASSTDNAVARYDLTTGKLLQNSPVIVTDAGAIKVEDGNASLPSYSFTSDPNSGWYNFGSGTWIYSGDGTKTLMLVSTGIRINSTTLLGFSSSNAESALDAAFERVSAGVVGLNNGTAGQPGVLLLRGQTIASLPASPVLGMQATITDGDSDLAWGATAINTGAGATKYLVWYNGTNWTVAGK